MRALLRSGVQFQSTLPARGATEWLDVGFNVSRPFQSTLPARGATRNQMRANRAIQFQSTLPARGATATGTVYQPGYFLISIHAPRTGSDASTQERFASRAVISIHAPRTGSDPQRNPVPICTRYFNPRSPHGERQHRYVMVSQWVEFQSTLPARGATLARPRLLRPMGNFNPRSPHGERLSARACGDRPRKFQSTLPARGATAPLCDGVAVGGISIHAPRTGSDRGGGWWCSGAAISIHAPRTGSDPRPSAALPVAPSISIHAPRTGSDKGDVVGRDILIFQSTLPARGATCSALRDVPRAAVFQSTLPARGATVSGAMEDADGEISIHAPRTGSDHRRGRTTDSHHISIHAPRTGSDGHNGV